MTWLCRTLGCLGLALAIGYAALVGVSGSFDLNRSAWAQTQGQVPGRALGTVNDAELWRLVRQGVKGTVSIPDKKAGVLVQSEGDDWRALRNGPVSEYGWQGMAAMLGLIAVFFLLRGRIRVDGGFTGRLVRRFSDLEVVTHWMTASSFIVLALTGLNTLYGKYVLIPVLGKSAFAALTSWGKYAHNYIAFAFILGLVLMLVLWIRHNLPDRYDLGWIIRGGGMFAKGSHPPAGKFNFGQKAIFWTTILGGGVASFTGINLMFPFDFYGMQDMQLLQIIHAGVALGMIVVIFGHIYIGTLGIEGAFDAMGTGEVDENWAKHHHSAWAAEGDESPAAPQPPEPPQQQPAE